MNWGMIGAGVVMGIAAMGSAIGIGIAGQGAIGAWKRCYLNNKPAPFLLVVFAGAPLTQTIYGFLLMNSMKNSANVASNPAFFLVLHVVFLCVCLLLLRVRLVLPVQILLLKQERVSLRTSWLLVFVKQLLCSAWFSV